MAKASKSIAFKNAVIDKAEGTITEFTKDNTKVYSIEKLLEDWDQVEGISLTIKQDDDVPADESGVNWYSISQL